MTEYSEPTPESPSSPAEDEARDHDTDQPDHTDGDAPDSSTDQPSSPEEAGDEAGAD